MTSRRIQATARSPVAWRFGAVGGVLLCLLFACSEPHGGDAAPGHVVEPTPVVASWSASERALLESLSLGALGPPAKAFSNRFAEDPDAAELGHRLFFDAGLSGNGEVACANCHRPSLLFTDGLPASRGMAATDRNAPTLSGVSRSTWMYWDGRRDSLWAQALAPLEAAAEMGATRVAVVRRVTRDPTTAPLYRRVFGVPPDFGDPERFPTQAGPFGDVDARAAWRRMSKADREAVDRAFANVGKAFGAYERRLQPGASRFDFYVEALAGEDPSRADTILSGEEIEGLRLFLDMGRTFCLRCHNGPLFTNQSFHAVGTASSAEDIPQYGRFLGIQAVLIDPFNCLGAYSDAAPDDCRELRFLDKAHVSGALGQWKTPTLRGLVRTAPYMHDGRFATLEEVIGHYRDPAHESSGPSELTPIDLDERESRALIAFLRVLDAPMSTAPRWLEAPGAATQARGPRSDSGRDDEPRIPGASTLVSTPARNEFSARSATGGFRVALRPDRMPIPLRRLHAWSMRIEDEGGAHVAPDQIIVEGGMRQHGHGFETAPRVTARQSNGDYRIEGLKFHMSGEWQLRIRFVVAGREDVAELAIRVGP